MSTQEMPALGLMHGLWACRRRRSRLVQQLPTRQRVSAESPPRGRAPASPRGSAKGSCTGNPLSTYVAVGSASIPTPLLPQGLRREGTG